MSQILNVFFWLFLPFKKSLQVFLSKGINILDQLTSVEVLIPFFGAVEHHVLEGLFWSVFYVKRSFPDSNIEYFRTEFQVLLYLEYF